MDAGASKEGGIAGKVQRDPSALPAHFDGAAYLRVNPDVAAAAADPAQHWKKFGCTERRRLRKAQELARASYDNLTSAFGKRSEGFGGGQQY